LRFIVTNARITGNIGTMMILPVIALLLAGLMVWGLLTSRKDRHIDRRHYATFVGFIAGAIAVAGVTLDVVVSAIEGHISPFDMGAPQQVFNVVVGCLTFVSIPVAFFAGLFSNGIRRIALIGSTFVVSLMLLLIIAAHLGD
jgi:hypothetical protein